MLIVNGPSPRPARLRLRRRLHGRRRRARFDDGRSRQCRCACATSAVSEVGVTSKSVFGQPARTGLCFGEWEERSPWPSLAEQRGFVRRRGRRDRPRRQGHVPHGRHQQRRPRATCSTCSRRRWRSRWATSSCRPRPANGQMVLAINPMWADRFGKEFPDIDDIQEYSARHCWQPDRPVARGRTSASSKTKDRIDANGRVWFVRTARPDRGGRVRRAGQPPRHLSAELGRQ